MEKEAFRDACRRLTDRQKEVLKPFLKGKDYQQIAKDLHCTDDNVRQHFTSIYCLFDLNGKGQKRIPLLKLFMKYVPEDIAPDHPLMPKILAEQGAISVHPTIVHNLKPSFPDVPMELDSDFYISPSCEQRCYEEVLRPGQIIRIRAPQKMGKTSLLYRILNVAEQEGSHTISLNLKSDVGHSDLLGLGEFWTWFCRTIAQRLELSIDNLPATKDGCNEFLQNRVLKQIDAPLVIALDRAEALFEYPEIAQEFFPQFRCWYDKQTTAHIGKLWKKLHFVIVHSTEPYINLSSATSPFENVGYVTHLDPLQADQVLLLANQYGLEWSKAEVDRLMGMVGGHPYLVQQALYALWRKEATLDELLQKAPTLTGIYRSHLQGLSAELLRVEHLLQALKRVIQDGREARLTDEERFRLEGLGLLPFGSEQSQMSCDLYRQFFQGWLSRLSTN